MEFAVGQVVVYGGHGSGRVVARETRAASPEPQEVVVVELAATLTVTLPIALAHEQLRAVVNETELANVRTTLLRSAHGATSLARRNGRFRGSAHLALVTGSLSSLPAPID